MKTQQLVIVVLIVLVGLGLFFLGRTNSEPGPDGAARITEALAQKKVPVIAITTGHSGSAGQYLTGLRSVIAQTQPDRVTVVHMDTKNPNERDALKGFKDKPAPRVMVLGLDGKPTYDVSGQYDAPAVQKAITAALTKKPAGSATSCDSKTCKTCSD